MGSAAEPYAKVVFDGAVGLGYFKKCFNLSVASKNDHERQTTL